MLIFNKTKWPKKAFATLFGYFENCPLFVKIFQNNCQTNTVNSKTFIEFFSKNFNYFGRNNRLTVSHLPKEVLYSCNGQHSNQWRHSQFRENEMPPRTH